MSNLSNIYPKPGHRTKIHAQHKVLMDAILAGNPENARSAAHEHLAYVEEALLEYGKEETRLERSLRRANITS